MAASKHGGSRSGAGRKKGSVSKTALAAEVKQRLGIEGRKLPLDIMLEAIEQKYAEDGAQAAFSLALAAAPYLHPRLQSVDANVSGALTVEVVRFGK